LFQVAPALTRAFRERLGKSVC